jgi:ankyrin repeat protein
LSVEINFSLRGLEAPDASAATDQVPEPTAEPGPPLIQVASEGDVVRVEALIASGADLEIRDTERATAVLDGGADPNLSTPAGVTSLMVAAEHGHEDIVEMLLDDGADFRRVADNGATALRVAIGADHDDMRGAGIAVTGAIPGAGLS